MPLHSCTYVCVHVVARGQFQVSQPIKPQGLACPHLNPQLSGIKCQCYYFYSFQCGICRSNSGLRSSCLLGKHFIEPSLHPEDLLLYNQSACGALRTHQLMAGTVIDLGLTSIVLGSGDLGSIYPVWPHLRTHATSHYPQVCFVGHGYGAEGL